MALKSLLFSQNGSVFLNSLKRFALSGVIVPRQDLLIAKIPAATSLTQPGRSNLIPLQGPADASSEVYSFTGKQSVVNQGIGKITTNGISTAVTGVGTKFLTQIIAGDFLATTAGTGTVLTVNSNTSITTTAPMAANATVDFFFGTTATRGAADNIFVSIQDQAWRRRLMNRDVPAIHVFGSNTKPLYIKESLLLETDQTLGLEFTNYDTSGPASFAPIAEARKWQYEALKAPKVYDYIRGLRERKEFIQPYWLTMDRGFSTLAAGARATEYFTCTGDITLVLLNVYAQAFEPSSGEEVTDLVTVSLSDAKTDRAIQSQPVPLSVMTGTAENPMRLPTPWIVEPQTHIKAEFVNGNPSSARVIMTFHGVAVYTGSNYHGSTLTNKHLMRESEMMYRAMSEPQVIPAEPQG